MRRQRQDPTTNRDTRSLAYVGIAFVALCAAGALNVIWRSGGRVQGLLMDFRQELPLPTRLAAQGRFELTVVVLTALALAIGFHRHQRAVLILVLLACLELAIAGGYVFAIWMFLRQTSLPSS
jgi:hypothetical protein